MVIAAHSHGVTRRTIIFAVLGVFVLVIIAGALGYSARNTRECKVHIAEAETAMNAGNLTRAQSLAESVRSQCGANNFPRASEIDTHVRALFADRDRARADAIEAEVKAEAVELQEVTAKLETTWIAYDHGNLGKAALFATVDKVAGLVKALPTRLWPMADRFNQAMYRARAASIARPEARARGDWYDALVPSRDPAQCLVWGSMWAGDPSSFVEMGFTQIVCEGADGKPVRAWSIAGTPGAITYAKARIVAGYTAFDSLAPAARTKDAIMATYRTCAAVIGAVGPGDRIPLIGMNTDAYKQRATSVGLSGDPSTDGI